METSIWFPPFFPLYQLATWLLEAIAALSGSQKGMRLMEERPVRIGPITLLFCSLLIRVSGENQTCRPTSCGDTVKISEPFRLKGDPSGCGDHRFELACENNRTIINLNHKKYYVSQINYQNSTIRVMNPGINKGNCFSSPLYSLSSRQLGSAQNPYEWPYEWGINTAVLLNCTNPVSDHNLIPIIHCNTSGNSFSSHTYSYALIGNPGLRDVPSPCTIGMTIFYQSAAASQPRNRSMSNLQDELLMGLELSFLQYYCGRKCNMVERYCHANYTNNILQCDIVSTGCDDPFDCIKPIWVRHLLYLFALIWAGIFSKQFGIFVMVIGGRTVFGILCLLTFVIYKFQRRHLSLDDSIEDFLQNQSNLQPIRYSYSEIKKITDGFKDKLGQGGFGSVYKGTLRSGCVVAVKVLVMSKTNGQDFINEVATIGRIHHVNIVRLIGFCVEGSKWALIYDFMPNGSLDKYIFPKRNISGNLSWERLYKIVLGVGQGIEYLHQGCDMQILHFDIKPHNILLDENFIPKVSDFGLAKLYASDQSVVSLTAARGTLGYIAPELFYKNIGGISYKADVYSFGMLLMEMLGKKRHVNAGTNHSSESEIYFPSWIYDRINNREDMEIGAATEDEKNCIRKMVIVALWCIQMNPTARPSMSKALEMLEGDIKLLKMPPRPTLDYQNRPIEDHGDNPIGRPASSCNAMLTISLDAR